MVILDKIPRRKLCVDIIGQPKFNILLKPFSLNPLYQKVYITHNKAMMISKSVDILCMTESSLINPKLRYIYVYNKSSHDIIFRVKISGKHQPSSLQGQIITIET